MHWKRKNVKNSYCGPEDHLDLLDYHIYYRDNIEKTKNQANYSKKLNLPVVTRRIYAVLQCFRYQ